MLVDFNVLQKKLAELPSEEAVDSSEVNPYLLNEVLRPLLAGRSLTYGDIDYSKFEADDLRMLSHYCDERDHVSSDLRKLVGSLAKSMPSACRNRAFC